MRVIDYLMSIIAALLSIGWIVLFYALRRNADGVEKTAALVLAEKEKLAALVLSEKEKLAAQVKIEHEKLEEKFNVFRIKVAEEYATTTLVEKILVPISNKLDEIERKIDSKLDKSVFERHTDEERRKQQ